MYRRAGLDELQPRADSFTGIMKRLLSGDLVNESELDSSLRLHHWEMNALCIAACIIPDPATIQNKSLWKMSDETNKDTQVKFPCNQLTTVY